nr:unnamed protein product [Callosobruchus analis]
MHPDPNKAQRLQQALIKIIFAYILLNPVATSAVFYNLPPLFTSRPLRPEELAQMAPHTTPKMRTSPFLPLSTEKRYHSGFSRDPFHNSPPLYTSRPLRPDELLQMAPHTTPNTWKTSLASFEQDHQNPMTKTFTGAIFHTSPPLFTSRPLLPEELIQMASYKNIWTTPFAPSLTTKRTLEAYFEEASAELSDESFDQPGEETDELYSPTLWSFGTYMSRNHTPSTDHLHSQTYDSQPKTDYANQYNLIKSETLFGRDHTPGANLAATMSPDLNLQKESVGEDMHSESKGIFEKPYTNGSRAPVTETYTSKEEEESLTKLQEGIANQFTSSSLKPYTSSVTYTSVTDPTVLRTIIHAKLPNSSRSSSEYPVEFDISIDHDQMPEANVSNYFAKKQNLYQSGSPQREMVSGEYYARGTKAPTLLASTTKFQGQLVKQTNPVEYVTYAEQDHTFGRNQAVSKSSSSRSYKESTTQLNLNSKHFIEDNNESESPILETSTQPVKQNHTTDFYTYAEIHHVPDIHEIVVPKSYSLDKDKKMPEKMTTTTYPTKMSTLMYETKPMNQVHLTESNAHADALGNKESLSKYSTSKVLNESLNQLTYFYPVAERPDPHFNGDHMLGTTQSALESSRSEAYKNKITNHFNTTESYSSVTHESDASFSQPSTFSSRKYFVHKSKDVSFIGTKDTPIKSSSTPPTTSSNRQVTKQPATDTDLSSQKRRGGGSFTGYMQPKNDTNPPNEEILAPVMVKNFTFNHVRLIDVPIKLSTIKMVSENKTSGEEINNQTSKQNLATSLIKSSKKPPRYEKENNKIESQVSKYNLGTLLVKHSISPSKSASGKQQPADIDELHSLEGGEKQQESKIPTSSPGSGILKIANTGSMVPLQPTTQSTQIETMTHIDLPEMGQYQTAFENDGSFFSNWASAKLTATSQPPLESATVDPGIGYDNQLHYSEDQYEDSGTRDQNIKYGHGTMHFENPVTFPQYSLRETTDAQTVQPQLDGTRHMTIYKQPTDNRDTQYQGQYGAYNVATTTLLPNYESTYPSTEGTLWNAVQGESYPVQQQIIPTHISNGGISWLVPQTANNAPAPRYTWWSSGANGKPSNIGSREGKFEVSSARNEIKLIYRPNAPAEVVPRSGSTHYETVEGPNGGKTHKLVLYV